MVLVFKYILMFVEVICSLLLIGVILMQRSKGQGAGAAFGGGMGEAVFGSQMGNVLTKSTVVLTFVFLVTTTLLAILGSQGRRASVTDALPSTAGPAPISAPLAPFRMVGLVRLMPAARLVVQITLLSRPRVLRHRRKVCRLHPSCLRATYSLLI